MLQHIWICAYLDGHTCRLSAELGAAVASEGDIILVDNTCAARTDDASIAFKGSPAKQWTWKHP